MLLLEQDFLAIILGVFIAMAGIVAIAEIIGKFSVIIGRPVKWIKKKEQDHELLIATVESVKTLQKQHEKDFKCSCDHENEIQETLKAFMIEMRNEVKQFTSNRIHDREQSFQIQKELTDSMKIIADGQSDRDRQIEALMCGSKELLGSTIDQLYSKYVALGGVPESEVDEFDDIFQAYKALKGNHRRDLKYDYIKNHLPIIPVETKLVMKHDE